MTPKVCILVSIPDSKFYENCTLVKNTLRVGFPTAEIHVSINDIGTNSDRVYARREFEAAGADYVFMLPKRIHHADWIRESLVIPSDDRRPVVILDADIHFWKSCEDWEFKTLMAGFYCPEMWNDWAQCRSVPRLHTSFLWFSDPHKLWLKLSQIYPLNGEYTPCNPFMCSVNWINGEPIFWDSTAGLYNMIGGAHFGPEHTECYEHLNSSGFVEEMVRRMKGKTGQDFAMFHRLAPDQPDMVKMFCWPLVKRYYSRKSIEAQIVPATFRDPVDRMKLPG